MGVSDKRERRKAGDLLPVLKARKDEFADWAYAGRPESMLTVFPGLEKDLIELKIIKDRKGILPNNAQEDQLRKDLEDQLRKDLEDQLRKDSKYRLSAIDGYFAQIPDAVFHDTEVTKRYGINLKKVREGQKYTLKSISEVLKIEYQNLDDIEKGRRKKIDRDLLMLFCGIYHTCPETLLGIPKVSGETPMDFFAKTTGQKVNYIINRLFPDAPLLLLVCRQIYI